MLTQALGCGGEPVEPLGALAKQFPKQAPQVLSYGRGFVSGAAAFGTTPQAPFAERLHVDLPRDGGGQIVLRSHHKGGFEVRVREEGMSGPGRAEDKSVMYPRDGGTSYWTTAPGGVEEWLHLAAGYASHDRPAARWHVSGAAVRQRGHAVELADEKGAAHVRVTAPHAYAEGGKHVEVRLRALATGPAEGEIELYVDAAGQAVLVDPAWYATSPMTYARYGAAGSSYDYGDFALLTGGTDGTYTATSDALMYDLYGDSWYPIQPMAEARSCHTQTALEDGTVLVVGGIDNWNSILSGGEHYQYGYWDYPEHMDYTRMNHASVRIPSQWSYQEEVLVTGGRTDTVPVVAEKALRNPPSTNAAGGGSGSGGSSTVYTCWDYPSGSSGPPFTTSTVEIYGRGEGTYWYAPSGGMNDARERHTASRLPDGTALVAGGEWDGVLLDTAEIYDTCGTQTFVYTPAMSMAREDHTATTLNDGTVLVAGGFDGTAPTAHAELYVPPNAGAGSGSGSGDFSCQAQGSGSGVAIGIWTPVADMHYPRRHATATLLNDGTVLVAGGDDGTGSLFTAEIYDPLTQAWHDAPDMIGAHSEHVAMPLGDGGVLVAGGYDDTAGPSNFAEIYYYQLALGYPCSTAEECQTGYCVEGVCCESICDQACYSCRAANQVMPATPASVYDQAGWGEGRCNEVSGGLPDPKGICVDQGPATCGLSGTCQWGTCHSYDAGTTCVPAACVNNAPAYDAYCDGEGVACPPQVIDEPCDPGRCEIGEGVGCSMYCDTDADCAPTGAWCNDGRCQYKKEDGQPAYGDNECLSGFVADGVCCDQACTGACQACAAFLNNGADGVCGPAVEGTNPHGECIDMGADSCGENGSCDGSGACALYPVATVCNQSSCSGSTLNQVDLCDGAGHCVDGGTVNCSPWICASGTCLTSCKTDKDCASTAFCKTGTCSPKLPNGTPSKDSKECLSGVLADDLCCDKPCAGVCSSCLAAAKGAGVDGTCGPVAVGTDPDNECDNSGQATCGTSGLCDGSGACALYAAGSVCKNSSCAGNTLTQQGLCDGSGACVAGAATDCAPGTCSGGTCIKACAVDADCVGNAYCAGTTCAAKKPEGQPATSGNQCLSGYFADGMCCDSACVSPCAACSAAKKGSGVDGVCGAVAYGTDPDHECAAQGAASCGNDGVCNGQGACELYPAGTVCLTGGCQGSTVVANSVCDGNGTCVAGKTTSCGTAACANGTCQAQCQTDVDCAGNAYCDTPTTTCTAKKPLGTPATSTNECASGFLVDGVCCNTACGGTCQACSAVKRGAGADGTCGPIVVGKDPDDECAQQPAASCGTTGTCDGKGGCALHPTGTPCGASSCTGTVAHQTDVCDGTGSCVAGASVDCGVTPCLGGVCQSKCTADTDCFGAAVYCSPAGTCAAKKIDGQGATGGIECLSGFVADGVCCDTPCAAGPCDACSVAAGAAVAGTCASLDGKVCDDGDACTQVDSCQAGVCVGASPVICPATDICHVAGSCDAKSGACTAVNAPNGSPCDDDNPCTNDGCYEGACRGTSKLDGTPCTGGLCIAGACVLDPTVSSSSSSSSGSTGTTTTQTTTTSTTTVEGTGGTGGGVTGDDPKVGRLYGGGCLSLSPADAGPRSAAPVGLLLGLLGWWSRRRRK